MELIKWRPELSVGIESIDDQHKQLVTLAQELQLIVAKPGTREQAQEALDAMLSYAAVHFATEEDLFEKHGYPEAAAHVNEHNLFVMKLNTFIREMDSDWEATGQEMLRYLLLWIKHHISSTDKAYTQFFKDRGVT